MQSKTQVPSNVVELINTTLQAYGTSLEDLTNKTPDQTPGQLLNMREVAKRLQVSVPTAYRMVKVGKLKPIHISTGCVRIPESQLVELAGGAK